MGLIAAGLALLFMIFIGFPIMGFGFALIAACFAISPVWSTLIMAAFAGTGLWLVKG